MDFNKLEDTQPQPPSLPQDRRSFICDVQSKQATLSQAKALLQKNNFYLRALIQTNLPSKLCLISHQSSVKTIDRIVISDFSVTGQAYRTD